MSDEEEDYMSCAFLDIKEDIRPGLVYAKSLKRKYNIEKKEKESQKFHKTKSRKVLEEESRNSGLNSAIGSDNKGFTLLQKMGYKPGMKLGNNSNSQSGLIEPIKVTVKCDRGGLGHDAEIKKRIEERERWKREIKVFKEKETETLAQEFRNRMRDATISRQTQQDLNRLQKTCQQLDQAVDVDEPLEPWFWFTQALPDDEEEEESEVDEELSPEEKVEFISDYLRPKYFYCFWCGIRYDNEEDMTQNCPGPDKDCHEDLLS